MSWGIHPDAQPREKIKAEMGDALKGLNSTGELTYVGYDLLWDLSMKLFDEMYELGKKEGKVGGNH